MVYQSGALIAVPHLEHGPQRLHVHGSHAQESCARPAALPEDLNCGCIDPYKDLVLNPNAWVEVPEGTHSPASPYFNDYRQARRPSEQFSLGRRISLAKWKEGMAFQIRAEFFNAFNRMQLAQPSSGNSDAGTTRAGNGT